MLTYYKSGDQIDYTNPTTAAITVGTVIAIGRAIGVAVNGIAGSAVGPVQVKGIVKVTKTGSQAWTQGQRVYLTAGVFTTVATAGTYAGLAALAVGSGSGETTGYVMLNAGHPGVIGTSAADTLGFHGVAGSSQAAVIAATGLTAATQATTTEVRAISVIVDALVAMCKTKGFCATA